MTYKYSNGWMSLVVDEFKQYCESNNIEPSDEKLKLFIDAYDMGYNQCSEDDFAS